MNIFDQYGIKEVADVTLYSIHKKQDGSGNIYYIPALFLDTLKISSTEQTADNVWAEGGYGNERLISWDYGKKININLEDALCTPASLGLCWNGILDADWKDAKLDIRSGIHNAEEEIVDRISTFEKNIYPKANKKEGTISYLLPRLRCDAIDENLDLLKISSVVDGTTVEGIGMVGSHSYKWRLAIESVVNSIAQVPDRFFDINGCSYPIDINRKVSVHSLPTYDNYKDAIIYKINSRTKLAPPLAKIIFDYAMEEQGSLEFVSLEVPAATEDTKQISLGRLLELNGYVLYAGGAISYSEEVGSQTLTNYYYPLRYLNSSIPLYTESRTIEEKLYLILSEDIIESLDLNIVQSIAFSYDDIKVTYNENHAMTDLCSQIHFDHFGSVEETGLEADICEGDYLAIIVDNNNDYHALIGIYSEKDTDGEPYTPKDLVVWYKPKVPVNVNQFKGLDMWLRFQSVNELIYFLITKYNDDITEISPATINANEYDSPEYGKWAVDDKKTTVETNSDEESVAARGRLWAYVNPKTMKPYDDDYWFQQGEIYLIKTLTLTTPQKKIKGKRISVKAGDWPGMYKFEGQTWIREYGSNHDERMQITIPYCKIKSDHSLNLQADGDPVTFNLELEVGKPPMGNMIEITTYEVSQKMIKGENGDYKIADGSKQVTYE